MRRKKDTIPFKVMTFNYNSNDVEWYDIMPLLMDEYHERRPNRKPKTEEEFKQFVKETVQYYWWARCEHEFVISHWPPREGEEGDKIDKAFQVSGNFDLVCDILKENLGLKFD